MSLQIRCDDYVIGCVGRKVQCAVDLLWREDACGRTLILVEKNRSLLGNERRPCRMTEFTLVAIGMAVTTGIVLET